MLALKKPAAKKVKLHAAMIHAVRRIKVTAVLLFIARFPPYARQVPLNVRALDLNQLRLRTFLQASGATCLKQPLKMFTDTTKRNKTSASRSQPFSKSTVKRSCSCLQQVKCVWESGADNETTKRLVLFWFENVNVRKSVEKARALWGNNFNRGCSRPVSPTLIEAQLGHSAQYKCQVNIRTAAQTLWNKCSWRRLVTVWGPKVHVLRVWAALGRLLTSVTYTLDRRTSAADAFQKSFEIENRQSHRRCSAWLLFHFFSSLTSAWYSHRTTVLRFDIESSDIRRYP